MPNWRQVMFRQVSAGPRQGSSPHRGSGFHGNGRNLLQISKIQTAGFFGCAGGRCRFGVAVDHVSGAPSGEGHEAAFGSAGAEPAGRAGMSEDVGWKSSMPVFEHQPDSRFVSAVAEVLALAGFEPSLDLVVGEGGDDLLVELGGLRPRRGSESSSSSSASHTESAEA
ncbi:hypothetical protein ACFRAQ_10305 [Nocardia sp. NPDC056611]|uniref:hypothetical protein n=1 Tax=Nocardia sp. NPDC056611 TaxID=3345877 RepID=UPI00366B66C9